MLNLDELEKKLDEALDKETAESLKKRLTEQRQEPRHVDALVSSTFDKNKELLNDFYNFVMDEGTGLIREDDVNAFLATQKHCFTPSEDDKDFCARCGENFRNTNIHITDL